MPARSRRHLAALGFLLGALVLVMAPRAALAEHEEHSPGPVGLTLAAPRFAADPDEVADTVGRQGYYVEAGRTVDEVALGDLVERSGRAGLRFYYVVLDEEPAGGTTAFADALLDRTGSGTAVVVSRESLGYSSYEFDSSTLNEAAEQSLPAFRRDPVEGFEAFTSTIAQGGASGEPSGGGGGGASLGLLLPLLLVGGLLGAVWLINRRSRREEERMIEEDIEEARRAIGAQVDALSTGILELSDRVQLADSPEATAHYRRANELFVSASDRIGAATDLHELEEIADRLDDARWELEAARAIIEGRPVPEKPADRPGACFFDANHGAGVEDAEIQTPAGSFTVGVCASCAAKLERGERPALRTVDVAGREVPLAYAPRSYGGFGLGLLGPFSILLLGGGFPIGGFGWGGLGWGGGGFGWGGGWGGGGFGDRGRGGFDLGGSGGFDLGGGGSGGVDL